ncbi:polysaccharide deacetylase family protein [Streptomyces sp. NPDC002490]|uniref:polysaccharide deacetylase family protein n=1 Tax=Streptomyces sp. NPDC002490 TaxID=3154416 RepID=UPI0033304765
MHESDDQIGATAPQEPVTANKTGKRRFRLRPRTVIAAVVIVTTAVVTTGWLTNWGRLETESPADVRAAAADDGKNVSGPVDCRKEKCIALTFDAGPGKYTPRLLDILKEEKVPATFFLLGRKHIDTYPELVRRIADEKHEVASHTWTHRRLTDLSTEEVREELKRTNDAIEELTGKKPTLMRPPQGRTDDDVNEVSRELGLSEILWTVTAKDYKTNDSDLIEERVLEQAGRDGIILLHDIYRGTVPAVPGIIDKLKAEGYTFVTVSQLFAPGVPEPGTIYR